MTERNNATVRLFYDASRYSGSAFIVVHSQAGAGIGHAFGDCPAATAEMIQDTFPGNLEGFAKVFLPKLDPPSEKKILKG